MRSFIKVGVTLNLPMGDWHTEQMLRNRQESVGCELLGLVLMIFHKNNFNLQITMKCDDYSRLDLVHSILFEKEVSS